jgi:hypothetical protein
VKLVSASHVVHTEERNGDENYKFRIDTSSDKMYKSSARAFMALAFPYDSSNAVVTVGT